MERKKGIDSGRVALLGLSFALIAITVAGWSIWSTFADLEDQLDNAEQQFKDNQEQLQKIDGVLRDHFAAEIDSESVGSSDSEKSSD